MIKKNIFLLLSALFLCIGSIMATEIPKKAAGTDPKTLPVKLTLFTAKLDAENVVLKWQTASETNSSHFFVEVSKDGTEFTKIATVVAAGNTNVYQDYLLVYSKTSYAQLFAVATLLLISVSRPKKYLSLLVLAFLVVICFTGCEKEQQEEINGNLYFRLTQVDYDGKFTMLGIKVLTVNFQK